MISSKPIEEIYADFEKIIYKLKVIIDPSFESKQLRHRVYSEIQTILAPDVPIIKEKTPDSLDFRRPSCLIVVVSLTIRDIGVLNSQLFSVTEKADGERHLLYLVGKSSFLINSANEIKEGTTSKTIEPVHSRW